MPILIVIGTLSPPPVHSIFTGSSLAYQTGPLGNFYQPTNSPLVDIGSTNANLVGLSYYTTSTNEMIESSSLVDIGYHYVATDFPGNPIDTNGDGIPDYLQDANGNGLDDSGETPWNLGIAVQPQSTNVVQGQKVTFSVVPSGIGPFTYQWLTNNVAISGATNSTYTKLVVQTNDAGNYSVIVGNATAGITSSIASLTVAVPLSITTQPTNETVLQGATTNFFVGVSGTTPVYQWFTNSVALVNNAHISGVNANLLTITSVIASDAANYWAIVTNLAGSVSSSTAALTVITPPNVTSAPGNQTNVQATDASFSVAATGIKLAYQWQFNGVNIAGATNSTYNQLVVQTNNAGTYSVTITNAAGSVTNNATLTVIVPPFFTQQPNSVITNQGSTAAFNVTAIGTTNLVYQWFKNRTNAIAGATTTNLTLANVQASNAAGYSILVTNNVGTNSSALAWLSVIVGSTTNYGWGVGSSPPSSAPVVLMSSPTNALANNAKVFRYGPPISIRASAYSLYGYITNVIFYYTGTNYGTNFMVGGTAVPGANTQYALAWTNSLPGTNIIRAIAWDNSGLSSTSSVVYVIMAVPPTISAGPNTNVVWTEGSGGTNILLAGNVSNDGLPYSLVTNAQWSVISGNGGYATISNPNSLATPVNFTTNGTFVMQLQVDNNFATNFQTCTVTIQRRPFVTLTSPTNNTTVLNGTALALNATASSLDSTISTVKFYTNGVLLGTALPSAGNTYALLWPNTYPWTNSVSAVATDARGLTSTSTVSVIILPNLTVQFVSPTSGQFFAFSPTNILLAALPASHVGSMVTSVTFSNQFMSLGSGVLTNSNYQLSWQYVTNGNYTLYVTAWDNAGNVATSSVAITVNSMPVVNILTPTSLQSYLSVANVTITAGAQDPDPGDSITNVVFIGNGTNLPFAITHSGSSTNWSLTWTNLSTAAYPITAIATDNHGASHSSVTRIFRVNGLSPPPVVAITSPANYASFNAWPDVTITANTFSSLGVVARVDFYNGNDYLGTDLTPYITSGSTNFEISLSGLKPGSYSLIAVASDTASPSRSTTSLPINITVGNSLPPNPDTGYWDPAFGDFDPEERNIVMALQFDSIGNLMVGGSPGNAGNTDPLLLRTDCAWTIDFVQGFADSIEAMTIHGTNVCLAGYFNPNQSVIALGKGLNDYIPIGNNLYFNTGDVCDTIYGKSVTEVQAIHVMNGDFYIGGDFNGTITNAIDNDVDTNIQFIATLSGNATNWSAVGASMLNGRVRAIADLNGTLYIGGDFTNVGPNGGVSYLAELTNGDWQPVGLGVNGRVCALTAHNGRLFVGGEFTAAGGLTSANLIACWDGTNWSSINNGLSDGQVPSRACEVTNRVAAIAARGDEIYVTGHFTKAWNGSSSIPANNVARAVWNDSSQSWRWFALGEGLQLDDGIDDPSLVNGHAIITHDLVNGTGYEVIVGGFFDLAGNLSADNVARWVVGQSDCPTNGPSVCLELMPYETVYPDSGWDYFVALATTTGSSSISNVKFYLDGVVSGEVYDEGYGYGWEGMSDDWQMVVTNLTLGQHILQAVVTDSTGLSATSVPIPFIAASGSPDPVPNPDTYYVTSSGMGTNVTLPVLINDSGGSPLHIVAVTNQNYLNPFGPNNSAGGTFSIDSSGTNLVYHANANSFGADVANYFVVDSAGTNSTWVTVIVQSSAQVQIYQPTNGWISYIPANFKLLGATLDADSTVEGVQFFANNVPYGLPIIPDGNGNFSLNWRTNVPGTYTFIAEAMDYNNLISFSPPVTITVTNSSGGSGGNPLVAAFNTPLPSVISLAGGQFTNTLTITTGVITNLTGSAYDPAGNPVSWQLLLINANNPDAIAINVTPGTLSGGFHLGAVTNGALGTVDLTTVENGAYTLTLFVKSSAGIASASLDIALNSNLKLGQFSFSQQDIVIPVNGIPLTVTRTYNSQNQRSGDFGYGWTYSLDDMDVELDEQRQDWQLGSDALPIDVNDLGDDNGSGPIVSIRTGGSRDVTLTLPDGRRTTFQFYFNQTGYNYNAMWRASPGVNYTLTAFGNPYFNGLLGYWNDVIGTSFDNYDFREFILLDNNSGTKYTISRGVENDYYFDPAGDGHYIYTPVFGPPQLTQIAQRSGATITIDQSGIQYSDPNGPGRTVAFIRDPQGRIISISDPNAGSNPDIGSSYALQVPTLKYIYNQASGNLVQVLKLVNSTTGLYSTNTFQYGNSSFPHYITEIDDPSGTPAARNVYDASGRLTAIKDANGNTNQFIYLTNNTELTIDPLGHTNAFVYDNQGNVTAQTNALGQIKTMAYDANNNKTNEITFLNGQPYATNKYAYDLNLNQLTSQVDPLGHTTSFMYDDNNFGNLLTSTDARNNTTINAYDGSGNLTNTSDALSNTNFNFYSSTGLPTGSKDPIGTTSTNYYDGSENLIATATLDASGKILSTNTFTYDNNANRLTSTVWRHVGSSWTPSTTTYNYDAQNRVTQTIDPDGGTNIVIYNVIGKQQATIDKLGHTNSYVYDAMARLIQTTYPDFTTETNGYDAAGNRIASADRLTNVTTYVYDPLNRLQKTIYADNTTNMTVYDGIGRVAQTIDARGTITGFSFDIAGRRLSVTNAFGISGVQNVSNYGYDANANQITFHRCVRTHDDECVRCLEPASAGTILRWDKIFHRLRRGRRRVAQTNQDSVITKFGYDGAGRLTSVTDALSQITRYQYDEAGNETAQVDALNRTNTYAYDSTGRRDLHTSPGNQTESFGYDLGGNSANQTNFNGVIITNRYDVMNRLTNRSSVNGYYVSFAYSATGQRTNMVDAGGTTGYSYDNRGRLTNKAAAYAGGPSMSLSYRYDANGNLTNLWSGTASGVTNYYQYDALNRLTNVLGRDSVAAGYTFDGAGNLRSVSYGNGVTNLYQYDRLNRLTNAMWNLNATTVGSFYYTLNLSGVRTNLAETLNGSRNYTWQYDNLYRLTNENISAVGTLGYGYDAVGNRTNRTSGVSGLAGQAPTYNTNDWLVGDVYDSNGNTRTNANNQPYFYDAVNQLTNFNNGAVLIAYDGDGNRVSKKVSGTTTYYLVDDRNPTGYAQVVEEYQGSLTAVYTHGLDLVSQRRSGTVSYFVYDGHGNVRALAGTSGTVTDTYQYDAYGTKLSTSTGSTTNNYLYTGEQFDSDLGFYYLRARYYKPDTGRFWTMDSYQGSQSDPLSLHKYLFGADNPINNIDPSGKSVYVMTRPLNIKGFENMGKGECHVFLAFDNDGMNDVNAWEDAVRESWDLKKHPNTYGIVYDGDPDNPTYSFHPKSVLTGDESDEYASTLLTPGSYVADQDAIDQRALSKTGTGYSRTMVAKGNDIQMAVFRAAVRSRDKNNNGTPDPMAYEFSVFNCGSWVQYIIGRSGGIEFPDKTINHGVGLLNPGANGYTAAGYAANAAAHAWKSVGLPPFTIPNLTGTFDGL